MLARHGGAVAATLLILACTAPVDAEIIRIRYYPQDNSPATTMKTADPPQPVGVKISGFGFRREPYCCQPKSNCLKTYCHPCTGQNVTLPLWLVPGNTPRIAHTWYGLMYDYGSFAVEVHFDRDGTVEVVYNNGPY